MLILEPTNSNQTVKMMYFFCHFNCTEEGGDGAGECIFIFDLSVELNRPDTA